jgi:ABC-2 type transport system permease protein
MAWAAFGIAVGIGQIGPLLKAPQWVLDLSPFTHSPKLPGGAVTATPLIVLTAIAVALVLAGVAGFRRRDVG